MKQATTSENSSEKKRIRISDIRFLEMTMHCMFNKYGFCKYRETCRNRHYEETCQDELCETSNCPKRHPRNCKYYDAYQRCKFGSFCLFAHRAKTGLNETEEMKAELSRLNEKIRRLEVKNECLEDKLNSALESMKTICEITVKEAIDTVLKVISKQQDEIERKQTKNFDLLQQSIEEIISKSYSNTSSHTPPHREQPSPHAQTHIQSTPSSNARVTNQCDFCGKSFGSRKALENHTRKDHEPKT